eukprot:1156108-Pelagomonas_calceolata.AAC.5
MPLVISGGAHPTSKYNTGCIFPSTEAYLIASGSLKALHITTCTAFRQLHSIPHPVLAAHFFLSYNLPSSSPLSNCLTLLIEVKALGAHQGQCFGGGEKLRKSPDMFCGCDASIT